VAIFCLARPILTRRWSFIAAAFTVGQYYFVELAGFARQEIALLLFAALVAAMLDARIPKRSQWALVVLFGLATAVSHYSTTYVAVTVIGLLIPLQWVASRIRDVPKVSGAVVAAFIAVFGGAILWYGPVTHSASHLAQFAQILSAQGLNLLPNRVPGQSMLSAYLQGNTKTPIGAAQYARLVHSYYAAHVPYVKPFPDAGSPLYALRNSQPAVPMKWHLGYSVVSLSMLLIEQLVNLLTAVGSLWMVLRRNASVITRQVGLLGLAATLLLSVMRVSGTLAVSYGQERALLQGMVFLSISLCWPLQLLDSRRKRRQQRPHRQRQRQRRGYAAVLAVACLAVIFVNTSGLVAELLGGGVSDTLANSGTAYQYFYETAQELSSARWLGSVVQPGQLVYADEYAQLPIDAVTTINRGLLLDVSPLTLNQHAWVYASTTNVVDRRAFALYQLKLASYVFPYLFLDSHYDTVFTDGTSEVFYR
jgi:uncharacterized membrane protein